MGGGRRADRARREQRAPHVRGAAARARYDLARRPLAGPEARGDHARPLKHAAGAVFDVKLVARLSSERLPLVGADLGADVERAQKSECTTGGCRAGEVEMETDLPPPAQVQPAGEVEKRRQLRQPGA